ncbi:MAG: glycogen synthase GlgA [candidate division FCPU426 bacterium]
MNILFPVSECVPFAKTGGLADVAQALPRALRRLGHSVHVVMPLYRRVWDAGVPLVKPSRFLPVPLGSGRVHTEVWQARDTAAGHGVYFLRYDPFYSRPGLYQAMDSEYPDNDQRFILLCRGALELGKQLGLNWDMVHVHDWHTGLIPAYLKTLYAQEPAYRRAHSLMTIHNLAYQGHFPPKSFDLTGLPPGLFTPDGLEFYGGLNFLKGGLMFADAISTVSPTYAREIQTPEFGCGLDGVLRHRRADLSGILNGVDYDLWDPARDPHLPVSYGPESPEGKQQVKTALLHELGLYPLERAPLMGMVSRLDDQKGLDLVAEAMEKIMQLDVQLVMLGVGAKKHHDFFLKMKAKFPRKFALVLEFNDPMAHRIYAGSDLFLMPSLYEPCGLGQLISLRYGTIPLVRHTGGLADTIVNYQDGQGNGFSFKAYSSEALLLSVRRALEVYHRKSEWHSLVQTAMKNDFSWDRSAREYEKLYQQLANQAAPRKGKRASQAEA